ncbi:hypothetical protein [Rhodococcus rhodochrous]|uniref:Uncharacterized protein n=1 Tax=Rhodococcus rhodochrous TaxID=1829 RepID=A0AA46X1Q0_RHORH|nr:hypothetical protein [Rhodococcus rhodochrous]UZF48478.1 hypothetical protein KUM34_029325 [Rhodococcus rhodochrous]
MSNLTAMLAADLLIENGGDWHEELVGVWASWYDGALEARREQADQGYPYYSKSIYGAALPPAAMFRCAKDAGEWDPRMDRLIVLVDGGAQRVVFEAWAWQALTLFTHQMTTGKEGDDLAAYQTLCNAALTPSGVEPNTSRTDSGRAELLSYKARSGSVEMVRSTDGEGKQHVQVTAFGIPTGNGSPTVRSFELPEETAPLLPA